MDTLLPGYGPHWLCFATSQLMSFKGVSAVLGTALIKGPHMNAVNSVSTNEPICLYGCPSVCLQVCLSFFCPPVYLSTKQTPCCLMPPPSHCMLQNYFSINWDRLSSRSFQPANTSNRLIALIVNPLPELWSLFDGDVKAIKSLRTSLISTLKRQRNGIRVNIADESALRGFEQNFA